LGRDRSAARRSIRENNCRRGLRELRARPTVYATLGTVPTFNVARAFLAALAKALGELEVDAVVVVGLDGRAYGPRSEG
jgi:UDP:flavonoid glycosyltransferase YjiC (YdhE family)